MGSGTLKSALAATQRGLPVQQAPELKSAVHWIPAADLPVHRWFRYREGFSPYLFDHFDVKGNRLDPFCGCGTTLVESARRGVPVLGIDVNPLATFVARVKTTPVRPHEVRQFARLISTAPTESAKAAPAPVPGFPLLKKLFQPQALTALLKLKAYIDALEDGIVKDLLLLNWLSILEECSNTFKEGNGLKYRNKRRRPGRYVTIPDSTWIPDYFGRNIRQFVRNKWESQGAEILHDLRAAPLQTGPSPRIVTGSCLDAENLRGSEPVQLAIFSPPYANRFDYFEAFKIEMWMGGFIATGSDMRTLRHASMRNNLTSRRALAEPEWPELEPFLSLMDRGASSVRMGIKQSLRGYFEDTRILLRNMRSVLAPNATVAIVVGNSAYARSIIPTDILTARVAAEEGYVVDRVAVARPLHVSSQQRDSLSGLEAYMRESVVVLRSY